MNSASAPRAVASTVIPAKAGIQGFQLRTSSENPGPRFRRGDGLGLDFRDSGELQAIHRQSRTTLTLVLSTLVSKTN